MQFYNSAHPVQGTGVVMFLNDGGCMPLGFIKKTWWYISFAIKTYILYMLLSEFQIEH